MRVRDRSSRLGRRAVALVAVVALLAATSVPATSATELQRLSFARLIGQKLAIRMDGTTPSAALLARIRAMLRRRTAGTEDGEDEEPLVFADLSMDPVTREVHRVFLGAEVALVLIGRHRDRIRFVVLGVDTVVDRRRVDQPTDVVAAIEIVECVLVGGRVIEIVGRVPEVVVDRVREFGLVLFDPA